MWFLELLKCLPRFFLWTLVFLASMGLYLTDKTIWYLTAANRFSMYVRHGQCKNNGVCCLAIGIDIPRSWAQTKWIVKLFNMYFYWIHNFEFIEIQKGKILTYQCHHLRSDNKCGIHPFRPKLCREFPSVGLFDHTRVYKDCGYWFIARHKTGSFEEKQKEIQKKNQK